MNAQPEGKTKILFPNSNSARSLRSQEEFPLKAAKIFTEMEAKRLPLELHQANPTRGPLISRRDC